MSNRSLFLFGASGHAKVVLDAARLAGYEVEAILDDDDKRWGSRLGDVPVLGGRDKVPELLARGINQALVAIGRNDLRRQVAEWLAAQGVAFATVIHPKAVIESSARIGAGTVVMAGGIINADAVVGEHSVLNTAASIDHDCNVGDYAHIAPGVRLCGGVSIGTGVLIGVGAVVTPGVAIGNFSTVGAGAVVLSDVQPSAVVVGVPARCVEKLR